MADSSTVEFTFSVNQDCVYGGRTLGLGVGIECIYYLMTPNVDHDRSKIDVIVGRCRSLNYEGVKGTVQSLKRIR